MDVPLPEGTLVMQVTITPQGSCSVNGPIHNKLIAYGMLEVARETISQFHASAAASGGPAVETAPASLLRRLDGGKNGKP